MKAKFKYKTLDADTRKEYQPSDDFVEVSEAFAKRLSTHEQHGDAFEVQGVKPVVDEKQLVREEYELVIGEKAGNKSIETMKAEIKAHKN